MTPEQQAELLIRIDERVKAVGEKQDMIHTEMVKHFADDKAAFDKLHAKTARNKNWIIALATGGLGGAGVSGFWDTLKNLL